MNDTNKYICTYNFVSTGSSLEKKCNTIKDGIKSFLEYLYLLDIC